MRRSAMEERGGEGPSGKRPRRLSRGEAKPPGEGPVLRNVWVRSLSVTKNVNHFLCRFAGVCSAPQVMGFGGPWATLPGVVV